MQQAPAKLAQHHGQHHDQCLAEDLGDPPIQAEPRQPESIENRERADDDAQPRLAFLRKEWSLAQTRQTARENSGHIEDGAHHAVPS